MQYFDGAHLSPNSVRNAVWHALNEPVLPVFTNEKPALLDYIHRQLFGASSERLTLYNTDISKTPPFEAVFRNSGDFSATKGM